MIPLRPQLFLEYNTRSNRKPLTHDPTDSANRSCVKTQQNLVSPLLERRFTSSRSIFCGEEFGLCQICFVDTQRYECAMEV